MSKNKPTIEQLQLLCRHIKELMQAGMTENHAIRTLELVADMYAKAQNGGTPSVYHVRQVPKNQWSLAALRAFKQMNGAPAGGYLRVEHGTPRRHFARHVRRLHEHNRLNEKTMRNLVSRYWMLAVITHEEDSRLKRGETFASPMKRWAAAGIRFGKGSPCKQRVG